MSESRDVERVKAILDMASSLAGDARRKLLERECGGDAALRAKVEHLLALHDSATSFLEPADPEGAGNPDAARSAGGGRVPGRGDVGRDIGPYTLLEKIGEGGFGAVYLAQQNRPIQRRVALKLVRGGPGASQVVARFEAERQALAVMEHPHIAVVHDAGVTDAGDPYFVMEHVDGLPITAYADAQRLGIDERLALFRQLCDAVQHAHEKAIVHRDLKPSNVLVERAGGDKSVVKVIDFGIAKAMGAQLAPDALHTATGVVVGTPEYMSPEQAAAAPGGVDTRSDVYSLGVILYELLAGGLPFQRSDSKEAGILGLLQLIREKEPPRFTARLAAHGADAETVATRRRTDRGGLERKLRGDLQWIVLKALEKDPARRYSSAAALSEDVGRHLANHPILARSPSTAYQLQKLVARHRGVAALAGVLVAALVVFGIAMSIQYNRQRIERAKAENINRFLQDMLASAAPKQARGDSILVRDVLDRAAARVSTELADDPAVQESLLHTLWKSYSGLGLYPEALNLAHARVDAAVRAHGRESGEAVIALHGLGVAFHEAGHSDSALVVLQESKAILESSRRKDPMEMALILSDTGDALENLGRWAESESCYVESLAGIERVQGRANTEFATALHGYALTLKDQGRYAEAETAQREALETHLALFGPEDPDVLSNAANLGVLLRRQRKYAEAESVYRAVLVTQKKVFGERHPYYGVSLANLAVVLKSSGKLGEAESLYHQSIEIQSEVYGSGSARVADIRNNLASLYLSAGRDAEAGALYESVLATQLATYGEDHPNVASARHNLAKVAFTQGKLGEAEKLERTALESREKKLSSGSADVVNSRQVLAQILMRRHRTAEAREVMEQCLAAQREAKDVDPVLLAWSGSLLGQCILEEGSAAGAESLLVNSLEPILSDNGSGKQRKRDALNATIVALETLGKEDEASQMRSRLDELSTK